jgi:hypothetical protein
MNWLLFFQTIAVSAMAGSAKAATEYVGSVGSPNKLSWKSLGNSALIGALLGTLAAMGQPPVVQAPAPQVPAPSQS